MKKLFNFLKKLFAKKVVVKTTPSGGGPGTKDVVDPKYSTKDINIQ